MPPPSPSFSRIAVLGGGITGLTAAWQLQRAGFHPVVFEKSVRTGGAIAAVRNQNWLHELGPNSLFESSFAVGDFIDDLGLGGRRIYANPAARKRFIFQRGRLVPMPCSAGAFPVTPLFSLRAKLALLGEPWRRRAPADADESVADFVERRLGREFLDYAVDPFVGGVYAGDPARLSVRHAFPKLHALEQKYGSLLRGALQQRNLSGGPKGGIFSFPDGLEELPRTITQSLGEAVRLKTKVLAIRRYDDEWEIQFETDGVRSSELFSAIVCALPADALAKLPFENVPEAPRLAGLGAIEHSPVASVFTGFRRADVRHPLDGFGVLVPHVEQRSILGALFSSTLFPGRAPEDHVAVTTFVGGSRNPALVSLDDAEILRRVNVELSRMIGVRAPPVFTHIHRWPRAIPQYTLGYQKYRDAMLAFEVANPGLYIGGNSRDGISLTHCIESGRQLATRAGNWVQLKNADQASFANGL